MGLKAIVQPDLKSNDFKSGCKHERHSYSAACEWTIRLRSEDRRAAELMQVTIETRRRHVVRPWRLGDLRGGVRSERTGYKVCFQGERQGKKV